MLYALTAHSDNWIDAVEFIALLAFSAFAVWMWNR